MEKYAADPVAEEQQLLRQLKAERNGVLTNHPTTLAIADRLEANGRIRCRVVRERSTGIKRVLMEALR